MQPQLLQHEYTKDLQIIKAVAQAWHSHSGTSSSTNEFHAHLCRRFRAKPSRFMLEAMSNPSAKLKNKDTSIAEPDAPHWDFGQSLWDSYELVTLAKKLETSIVFDDPLSAAGSELEKDSSEDKKKAKGEKE